MELKTTNKKEEIKMNTINTEMNYISLRNGFFLEIETGIELKLNRGQFETLCEKNKIVTKSDDLFYNYFSIVELLNKDGVSIYETHCLIADVEKAVKETKTMYFSKLEGFTVRIIDKSIVAS